MVEPSRISDEVLGDAAMPSLRPGPAQERAPLLGWWLLALVILAAAAGAWWVRHGSVPLPATPPDAAATPQTSMAPPAAAASAPAQAASMNAAALARPEPPAPPVPLAPADVAPALAALVGPEALRQLLIDDDFVRRVVVTVDNLGRDHAPARLWPARPTPGRFQVVERDGRLQADLDNGARYTPLVLLTERIDMGAVVDLYGRMLPLLQQAYEELGYPGQRFHARLLAVIDHLLAAPQPPRPLALTLVEVKGELPSHTPWLRYEFADPALEAASAGHKLMMRVGEVNERRLKTQLRALRAELVRQAGR